MPTHQPTSARAPGPTPPRALATLLTNLIDYAGLFPPAKLAMGRAAEDFTRARMGEHEWALGRFVCPASRLEELSNAAGTLMPGTLGTSGYREQMDAGDPWTVSALLDAHVGDAFLANLDHIDAFNARHADPARGLARVDMVEVKVSHPDHIDQCLDNLPDDLFPFFEFPVDSDCRGYITALAGEPCAAKIRTGGITSAAFPTPDEIASFLIACHAAEVPFKATAGLHHPVRARHRLTYEPDSASCTMHGFLNIFVAATLLKARKIDRATCLQILTEEDPRAFAFADDALKWRSHAVETAQIAHAREAFALSFGSCSFDEPFADLTALTLI
jgi:hypothetical protein